MLGKNMKVTQFSVRTPSPLDCLLLHCPTLWPPPTLWPLLLDNLIRLELLTHRYKHTHTMGVFFFYNYAVSALLSPLCSNTGELDFFFNTLSHENMWFDLIFGNYCGCEFM